MNETTTTFKELIDELTYRSYSYNRQRSLEIPAEHWRKVFSNADNMEKRFQTEVNHDK
jgi:hypothetical protein